MNDQSGYCFPGEWHALFSINSFDPGGTYFPNKIYLFTPVREPAALKINGSVIDNATGDIFGYSWWIWYIKNYIGSILSILIYYKFIWYEKRISCFMYYNLAAGI